MGLTVTHGVALGLWEGLGVDESLIDWLGRLVGLGLALWEVFRSLV